MKKLIYKILFLSIIISNISFPANELYRSKASGNWTTPATWEYSTDGGASWITATITYPDAGSGATEVRNLHNVVIPTSTQLTINEFIVRTGGTITLNSGSSLTITDQTSQDLLMESGSNIIGNGGVVKTKGNNVEMHLQTGCNFIAPLKIDSLTSTVQNFSGDITAVLKGPVEIDSGSTLNVQGGGYRVRFDSTLRNLGNINGSASFMDFNGYSMVNFGNISITTLTFNDSSVVVADTISKSGKFTSPNINISSTGRVKHNGNNWTIGPSSITINIAGGGKLDVSSTNFILDGTGGTIQFNLDANGKVVYSGSAYPFQTKGNVNLNLRTGSNFNAGLMILSGTTTCYSDVGPSVGEIFSPITINGGAIFNVYGGGYGTRAYNTVINNGTITGSSSYFFMRGSSFANSGTVTNTYFYFDSTTSLSGTGIWGSSYIYIRSTGNVSLANNLSMGASSAVNFYIEGGGVLNPNTRTLTLSGNLASLNFAVLNAGTTFNSGLIQTQGTVNLDLQTGCIFNSPLKVNTGTSTAYSSVGPSIANFNSPITVDAGSNFNVAGGGYGINSINTLTNSGAISGSGSFFYMNGNSIANNGTINVTNFYFDDTTSISGNGLWASPYVYARNSSMISLANSLSFGPANMTFTLQSSCSLNPNNFVFTLIGNPGLTLIMQTGSVVKNSGTIRTQQNISLDLQTGCNFNAPLNVNTGTTSAYCTLTPVTAVFNGTILIDTGAVLNVTAGGYSLLANENVTNNGTISGNSSSFFFSSQIFTNNGIVNVTNFYFRGIVYSPTYLHTLQGTGIFTTPNAVVEDGANVTMASDHQFNYLTINYGGTLDINSKTLKLSGAGSPIAVNGFLLTTGSTIEYKGTAPQSIVNSNIEYANLKINDTSGVTCTNNFNIPGTLQLTNGDMNLNGKIINLLATGTYSETTGNTITGNSGYIVTTRNINAPSNLNVAGLGAIITTLSNLGMTEIKRGPATQTLFSGAQTIRRYYTIKPVNNSNLNATLIFKYDESELNGNPEALLNLYRSPDAGTGYVFEGGTLNTTLNQITLNNINSFARYTAASYSGFVNVTCLIEGYYNLSTLKLNMKDTITVQLRNHHAPFNIIDTARATLDSVTFISNLRFNSAPTDTYYVVVNQRNSIQTWSKPGGEAYTVAGTLNYNFSNLQSQAYGNNTTLVGTKWTNYSGDVNHNGIVDLTDIIIVYNDAANFAGGYVNSDLDGNRIVDLTDILIGYNNSNKFVSIKRP